MTDSDVRAEAVDRARRAMVRHEEALRRLGAVGELQLGVDPVKPTPVQWWARCFLRRPDLGARPLLVDGYGSALDALAALADAAAVEVRRG